MATVSRAGGRIFVRLPGEERAVLGQLPALVASVGSDPEDAAADRMAPDPYPGDESASWEFSRMTRSDLDGARHQDAEAFAGSLDAAGSGGIATGVAEAWVRVLGDARLVLAAREGIALDGELPEPSASNPRIALVHYLGVLQHEIVETLLGSMADT